MVQKHSQMKLFLLFMKAACQLIKNTHIAFGMYTCCITVIVIKAMIKGRKDGKSFLKTNTSVKTNQPARDLLPHPKLSHNNVFSPLKGNEIWKLNYSSNVRPSAAPIDIKNEKLHSAAAESGPWLKESVKEEFYYLSIPLLQIMFASAAYPNSSFHCPNFIADGM